MEPYAIKTLPLDGLKYSQSPRAQAYVWPRCCCCCFLCSFKHAQVTMPVLSFSAEHIYFNDTENETFARTTVTHLPQCGCHSFKDHCLEWYFKKQLLCHKEWNLSFIERSFHVYAVRLSSRKRAFSKIISGIRTACWRNLRRRASKLNACWPIS